MKYDIIKMLEENNVPFKTSGKDIASGWIGLACPSCGDSGNHLGFKQDFGGKYGAWTCWRCGVKNGKAMLAHFLNLPFKEIDMMLPNYKTFDYEENDGKIIATRKKELIYPHGLTILQKKHYRYLNSRGFEGIELEKQWGLKATVESKDGWGDRVIIPIRYDGEIVSYLGRDITGRSPIKSLNCKKEHEKRSLKDCLFGAEYVNGNSVIVTEGAFDAFRVGRGLAVSTFGIKYSREQMKLLSMYKNVFICFDCEKDEYGEDLEPMAKLQAEKLADELSIFSNVYIIEDYKSTGGDPCTMVKKDLDNMLREVANITKENNKKMF